MADEKLTKVKCVVDSCHYWGNGNVCKAGQIEVRNMRPGRDDMEFGTIGEYKATTSEETCCGTFKPRKG